MPPKRRTVTYRKVAVTVGEPEPDQVLIERVGQALYGEFWQSPMARELGTAIKTVQRWSLGHHRVGAERWGDLLVLLEARREKLEQLQLDLLEYSARQLREARRSAAE